jgi:importin-9
VHVIPSLITLSGAYDENPQISGHLTIRNVAYPFLQGRCLFLASRFAELLPADVRGQYFEAAIQVIESNETEIPFKVSAVKSIQQSVFLSSLKPLYADLPRLSFAEYISDAELAIVPRIVRDLGPFLLETSEDTLSLVLETVSVLAAVGKGSWFTTDLAVALTTALLDVWPKNIKGMFCHTFHVDCADALCRSDLLVSTQRHFAFCCRR